MQIVKNTTILFDPCSGDALRIRNKKIPKEGECLRGMGNSFSLGNVLADDLYVVNQSLRLD